MSEKMKNTGFYAKVLIMAIAMVTLASPVIFGRTAVKMYSIGSNTPWSSVDSWSLTPDGNAAGFLPASNDTVVINSTIVQNSNLVFSGNGMLIISISGLLKGENLAISFSNNAKLQVEGNLRTGNLHFVDNSGLIISESGSISVNEKIELRSDYDHFVSGKLNCLASFGVFNPSKVIGDGTLKSELFYGDGIAFSITDLSIIPSASTISFANWVGSSNTDWFDVSNWSNGVLPSESKSTAILNLASQPTIAGKAECKNLYINSSAVLSVKPSSLLDVTNDITINSGGSLILKNSTSERSSLIFNGTIYGQIKSEYPVVAETRQLLASPVGTALTGTFLNMYLRTYDEEMSDWGEYIVPTVDPLEVMTGYEIYSLYNDVRIIEGTPDLNAKTFAVSNLGNGLNLTGNPFSSYIDWENTDNDAWQRNAVASAIYYPDPSGSGNYAVYLPGGDDAIALNNGSRYIAPMQGFFVKASEQAGSLTVQSNSRVREINDSKLSLKHNSIKFRLSTENGTADEVLFRVMPDATAGFDNSLDAIKFESNPESAYLYLQSTDDTRYAVNSIPAVASSMQMPLSIHCAATENFKLSVTGAFDFEIRYPVVLEDKELKLFMDLREDSLYAFTHSPEMNSDRFVIHFDSPDGIAEEGGVETNLQINFGEVVVSGTENEIYTASLFSTDGKLISSNSGILSEGINLATESGKYGVCILQLSNAIHRMTQKILTK